MATAHNVSQSNLLRHHHHPHKTHPPSSPLHSCCDTHTKCALPKTDVCRVDAVYHEFMCQDQDCWRIRKMKVRTSFWTLQRFRQTRPSRNSYMCHAPMPLRNEVKKFNTSGCETAKKKDSTPQLFTPKPVSKRTWSRETLTAASMLQWTHCTTSNEGLVSALSLRNSYSVHERNLTIHSMRRGNSAKWFMATWKAPRR